MAETQTLKTKILLRNDVASAWVEANPVLLRGEIGIEIDTNKFKIGDGVKSWDALSYVGTQVNVIGEGEAITGASVSADGTLTLTRGKLYLDDIYLEAPLTYTANIGVLKVPASGSGTVGTAGGTLLAALNKILAEAKAPTITQPSVSIALTGAGAKEVGTEFTPSFKATFNQGKYEYGPSDTGVTATYRVTDTAENTPVLEASGTFTKFTVGDSTNYKVSVVATHTAGVIPVNNLGEAAANLAIKSGSKSANSNAVTGYRNSFWGSTTFKTGTPNSAIIRGLSGKKNGTISAGNTGDADEAVGALRVIIAVPSPRTITSIKDVNGLNAEAFSAFTHTTVEVEGANGYTAKTYNVYYKDNAGANDKANKWHFTVA